MAYKVKFDTGQIVEFQNKPTDADIEEVVKKLGIKPKKAEIPEPQSQQENKPGILENIGGFFSGVQKGATKTAFNIGSLALRGEAAVLNKLGFNIAPELTQVPESVKQDVAPQNIGEKIGQTTEQIGEFLIPVGTQAKALGLVQKVIPNLAKNTTISAKLANLLVKSVAEGAEFGGKTILQTGGDMGKAIDSALIGFIAPPIFGAVGKVGKLVTRSLPEKLYSQIFKTAEDDLMQYYRTVARGGKINPTLAREALDRGLKGNSKSMAVYSIKKLDELEQAVQKVAQTSGKKISIENRKGYINILQTIKDQFKNGFLSGRAKEADKLIKELKVPVKTGKLSSLAQEARKYKSAEEFMNNIENNKLLHGSSKEFTEFKLSKDNLQAIFLSKQGEGKTAEAVGKQFGKTYEALPVGKIKTFDPSLIKNKDVVKVFENVANKYKDYGLKYNPLGYAETDIGYAHIPGFIQNDIILEAKKLGYNHILFREGNGEISHAFTNPKNLQILPPKSQLTDIYNQAKKGATKLSDEIDINTGLKLKRFIDKMRATSSFKQDPRLTPRQEEFKFAADTLRKKVADAGLKDLMNEERIYIEAIDSIVSDAARRNNKVLLNLTDVLLGGGGVATGFPGSGLGAAAAVRGFQQPITLTNLAQILFKSGNAIETIVPLLRLTPKAIPPLMNQ